MTSEREPRILIVDDRREVARVLRTSLELQNKGYLITDVPSGEEALLELLRVQFDLMVTDFRLPGMSGPELIRRAQKRAPDCKFIVISGYSVSEVRVELGDLNVLAVFEKPIDTSDFTATVNETLLGETETITRVPTQIDLVIMSEFDTDAVTRIMDRAMRDVAPRAMVFVNRAGKVMLKAGLLDESLRFSELAVLLANNFTTTAEISTYLGDSTSYAVHYYSGDQNDIYALSVGLHFFLVFVFPSGSQKQMGPVLRFGKAAADQILESIEDFEAGEARAAITRTEPVKVEATGPLNGEADESAAGSAVTDLEEDFEDLSPREVALRKAEAKRKAKEAEDLKEEEIQAFAELHENVEAEQIELDLDALDAALGELDDLNNFWEEAEIESKAAGSGAISIDEAIELGLVPKDAEE